MLITENQLWLVGMMDTWIHMIHPYVPNVPKTRQQGYHPQGCYILSSALASGKLGCHLSLIFVEI
jgi:hypothetical protein